MPDLRFTELARRWADADTQNQVAWLTLARIRKARGDDGAARASFERAALASRWHDHYHDAARLLVGTLPRDLSLVERDVVVGESISQAGPVSLLDALETLGIYCEEGGAMREPCLRIVQTMVRTPTTRPR